MSKAIKVVVIILLVISIVMMLLIFFGREKDTESVDNGQTNNTLNSSYCKSMGCGEDTVYVGSLNSDKYYECNCRWAKLIEPENLLCFSSDAEAVDAGYVKSEC